MVVRVSDRRRGPRIGKLAALSLRHTIHISSDRGKQFVNKTLESRISLLQEVLLHIASEMARFRTSLHTQYTWKCRRFGCGDLSGLSQSIASRVHCSASSKHRPCRSQAVVHTPSKPYTRSELYNWKNY